MLPMQRGNVKLSNLQVLDRVFEQLQRDRVVRIKVEALGLDSG